MLTIILSTKKLIKTSNHYNIGYTSREDRETSLLKEIYTNYVANLKNREEI